MKKILVIPDTQSKEGVRNPLIIVGKFIQLFHLDLDYIIHLGDHWDFPSLSSYDKGKKSHRALSYLKDVRAGNKAMIEFMNLIGSMNCKKILLTGNHEFRRERAIEYGPDELVDMISEFPLYTEGWDQVAKFLEEVKVQGVTFCHYFQNKNSANPISTANALLKKHASCVAGHLQGFQYAEDLSTKGRMIQTIIAGSCYYHDEKYKAHNNHHFRGAVLLFTDGHGGFDFERITLKRMHKLVGEK